MVIAPGAYFCLDPLLLSICSKVKLEHLMMMEITPLSEQLNLWIVQACPPAFAPVTQLGYPPSSQLTP